jgi:2-hydroxychromene-2-carboxylate isomerase
MNTARQIDWYFDFISPYAWLQAENLRRLPAEIRVRCKPVLFAGLLEHWGQLGPAEIPAKRVFTYQYIVWKAARLGLQVRMPPVHPFNPLPLLRLAVLLADRRDAMLRLFRFVWSEGKVADDKADWQALIAELNVPDAGARIASPEVKTQLRRNGEEAVSCGVFGVPTLVIDDMLFWGADATDMALDYLTGDPVFASDEMRRAATLPAGQARQRSPVPAKPGVSGQRQP